MKKELHLMFFALSVCTSLLGQTITKSSASPVNGTVCPVIGTTYEVSVPTGFENCTINWSATNGEATRDPNNQRKATVKWSDVPGAKGKVTATFSGCGNSNDGAVSLEELILSVKNKAWGAFGNSINIDFCTRAQVGIIMPRMFVQGTGGVGEPPQTEVRYGWTLPAGWRQVGSGLTGAFATSINSINIEPIGCSVPGVVRVEGVIIDRCGSAAPSATASITLNGVSPVATIGPQLGYTGGKFCNLTPVTFTASLNVALGCISSYTWNFPSSWSGPVTTTTNTVTRTPDGTPNIASPISVTVNFTCGTSVTSGNFTPTFTPLSLSGPDIVCSTGSFSLANAEFVPIGNVSWNVSPSTLVTPSSGSGTLNASISKVASGSATFTYTATCNAASISVSKSTFVGTYGSGDVSWVGPSSSTLCRNQYYYPTANLMPNATSYDWITTAGWFVSGQGTRFLTIRPPATGSGYIGLRVNNVCGVGGPSYKTQGYGVVSCGGAFAAVSPNPASNKLNVSVIESETATAEIQEVKLYDKQGLLVREFAEKGKVLELNLEGLPRGMYFLSIRINGEISKERLMIEY